MSVVRNADLKKVKFGNSDMMVTEACVGTMTWGSFNDKEEQAYEQLDKAIEMGVNFIDTAELYPVAFNYGKTTEEWMGRWLADRTAKGNFKREDIYLATKVNPSMLSTLMPWNGSVAATFSPLILDLGKDGRRNPLRD